MTPDCERLRGLLVSALRNVPGARVLVEFGSSRAGKSDEFSDIDFQLLVDDCAAALPAFLTILGDVIEPELEWTISDDPDHYWLMVIPDGTRPWFKVDIGLDPYHSGKPDDPGWSGDPVWSQDAPTDPVSQIRTPDWARPAPGTIDNFVLWQLIDLGRLAKFKHRNKPLNMLKFLSQLAQAVVIVEAVRLGQHDDLSDMPSTASIAAIDQSASLYLVDLMAPLVDHIRNLSLHLCSAIVDNAPLRSSCERMVMGSDEVLRRYP